MIPKLKLRVLALPLALVALAVSIDCSNSSANGCPGNLSDLDLTAACSSEGFVCPYDGDTFDQSRTDTVSDCFQSFVEYTCTQKKWTLTAQAATVCSLDLNGALTSPSPCALGSGRCAVAAGTVACVSSGCYEQGGDAAYSGACISGQFVVTPTSCTGLPLDAGEDAAPSQDAGLDDAAANDSGVDGG